MHKTIDNTEDRLYRLKEEGFIPNNILDIGANTGQFFSIAKKIFPESDILSIEGNPNCEPFLKDNNPNYLIRLLGSEKSIKKFYINKNNDICTGGSIYKETTEFYLDCSIMDIEMSTLDEIDGNFDLIKIDVQGSELDILKGGIKKIIDCDYLLIELSIKKYNSGSPLIDEVIVFLSALGFKIYDIFSHFYYNDKLTQIDILFLNCRNNDKKFKI